MKKNKLSVIKMKELLEVIKGKLTEEEYIAFLDLFHLEVNTVLSKDDDGSIFHDRTIFMKCSVCGETFLARDEDIAWIISSIKAHVSNYIDIISETIEFKIPPKKYATFNEMISLMLDEGIIKDYTVKDDI